MRNMLESASVLVGSWLSTAARHLIRTGSAFFVASSALHMGFICRYTDGASQTDSKMHLFCWKVA